MPSATYVQSSFTGGEWSQLSQGRYHDPKYRTALNVCLNGLPAEDESWRRRPGFSFAGTTRSGVAGRTIPYPFQQSAPYTMEFTDAHLRFWSGLTLVGTNDDASVIAISSANPAVMQLSAAVTWITNDQGYFIGSGTPTLLQNRVFILTKSDTTHFSLSDAVTGSNIDGATLSALGASVTFRRALDFTSPFVGSEWATLRSVQTETTAFLFETSIPPYAVVVSSVPTSSAFAQFTVAAAIFNDGPYLDPFNNGVQATPSAKLGIVTLTLSFPAYDASKAYPVGYFVSSASVNYESLVDQNVGNTPATSPTDWAPVNAGTAIDNGVGFNGTDVGRSVRLFSEPPLWAVGTTYAAAAVVAYNPSGLPGQTTYWSSVAGANTGNIPGADLTHWAIMAQGGTSSPALWSWGRIVSLSNAIDGLLAGSLNIGNMTSDGGLAAAFDGVISKTSSASAVIIGHSGTSLTGYVGKNYSGASAQAIQNATIYPSSDIGFGVGSFAGILGVITSITFNLRGKASAPASASDGTLLGTLTLNSNTIVQQTISSNDTSTTWNYVWIEIDATYALVGGLTPPDTTTIAVAQVVFFNPPGTGTSSGVNVEIIGPSLLYTTPIRTWRLGLLCPKIGYSTCGTYSDGRLWISGSVPNRFDTCVANGIIGGTVNFAPTDQYGNVLASSAITYTFNAPDANPIFWMTPDLQGVIAGTLAGEWLITAPTTGGFSPTNISARRVTQIGCANIEPRRTEHTTVFVQKFGRKVMEYFADVFSGKFTAPNLTWLAKHLTVGNIQELSYQQELVPTIWARVNGALRGCTYRRDTLMTSQGPTMNGWHRHVLGSGRTVEYMCVGPSIGGTVDALTIVTNDTTTNVRHVEVLGDLLDESSTLADASYLDDAVTPFSSSVYGPITGSPYGGLTLNGLWHLNGATVQAWLGGLDCGLQEDGSITDFVVSSGSISVPFGDGISAGSAAGLFTAAFVASFGGNMPMRVGFTYTSDGQLVRPNSQAESGARDGPAFGKWRRNNYVMAQLEGTQGVLFGTTFADVEPADFKQADGFTNLTNDEQFTGIFRDQIDDNDSFDGMICWRITRPYICNIAAIGAALDTRDV